jgi:hypothetical protein
VYCTISTLGLHDFHVTMVTRRFTCSPVDLTCDKPISCSQMTLNRKFYIKLGVGESQNRFADSDFVTITSNKFSSQGLGTGDEPEVEIVNEL